MTKLFGKMAVLAAAALTLAAPWAAARAIDFDEVRDFEEVFLLSAEAPARDRIEVRWAIEDGFYLYNNKFLQFRTATEGVVLGEPQVPPGERGFDELLGEEVEKYHGELRVTVPVDSVAPDVDTVQLTVRSQGCMEDVLCYPPTAQRIEVRLPPGGAEPPPQASAGLADTPLLGDYEPPALSAEEAFRFESIGLDPGTALLRFTAQPGYYLYVDKFEFSVAGADGFVIAGADLPEGVTKDDPEFGPVPVYYGQVEIPLRFNRPAGPAQDITVEAKFQGCRDGDICYPPMTRAVTFSMPAAPQAIGERRDAPPAPAAAAPVSDQDRLARLLTSNPWRAVLAFFVAGLLLAFTPCVLPMVPILSGIIIGQGDRLTTMRAF
ncbi:MAG: protein-disulfide reductase DsbD family protein, partial [Xanthomonadales bacterium]